MMEKTKVAMVRLVTVRLTEDEYDWLTQESERDKRSKSVIIEKALREYRAKKEQEVPTL